MTDVKSEPDDEQAMCVIKLEQQEQVPPHVTSMETPLITPKVLLKAENNSSVISYETIENTQNVQIKTQQFCDLNIELKSERFVELEMELHHVGTSQAPSCASFDCLSQDLGSALILDSTFPMLFDFESDHMLCKGTFPVMKNEQEIAPPVSIELQTKLVGHKGIM